MITDRAYVEENKQSILNAILNGSILIYPTDTIYGIGCNALNSASVLKIRQIKQRGIKPFSVIAPNHEWILHRCITNNQTINYIQKLPGPYTLIINLINGHDIPDEVNPIGNGTIGVRIPYHWFAEVIKEAGVPFITTSVNISGMPYMTSLETLDETIKNNVDFIIYEGEINGRESTKIDLTQ
ncbi:MAG: threonylcarbamoyl-AMP synthase [Candidatus Vogelbacteria bacterium]|nr:threonylcarbamoyl-AMP synthase [Candidatus Vogelbacteria bacterium]